MPAGLYEKYLDACLADQSAGRPDFLADTIKVILVEPSKYTVDLVNDQFLSDIPTLAIAATFTLTGKATFSGAANAIDATFLSVPTGPVVVVAGYKDTGTPSTSQLLFYNDVGVGIPVTPGGGDIVVKWENVSPFIYKL